MVQISKSKFMNTHSEWKNVQTINKRLLLDGLQDGSNFWVNRYLVKKNLKIYLVITI